MNGETEKSSLISRNITVSGKRTSVRLEPEMWNALKEIAKRESCTIHDLCGLVHARKKSSSSLTASIRVFVMLYYRAAATEEGHKLAGHGRFDNMIARARLSVKNIQRVKSLSSSNYSNANIDRSAACLQSV